MMVRPPSIAWLVWLVVFTVLMTVGAIYQFAMRPQKDVGRLDRYRSFIVKCTHLPGMDFDKCDTEYDEMLKELGR